MAKVKCPNGHIFESSIYGLVCPLCNAKVEQGNTPAFPDMPSYQPQSQQSAQEPQIDRSTKVMQDPNTSGRTSPIPQSGNTVSHTQIRQANTGTAANPVGNTVINGVQQSNPVRPTQPATNRTTIRRVDATTGKVSEGRKLVGFLVCYSRYPQGRAFNIYEGRNYIGRDSSCDICIPDDHQLSGRHMSILYRSVDNKFKFRDEQSSNGTFINKEILDDGELQNYDIIRVGSTLFIFIAIPQIG